MNKKTLTLCAALPVAILCASATPVPGLAQGNDFFGSAPSQPGDPTKSNNVPGAQAAEQALNNNPSDYTADEKRMQKKFKANILLAQKLVTKGDRMMKDGEKHKDQKSLKKGKILKEIGEKRISQLKENNPVSETAPPK